jgi:hypothetical protein
VNHDRVGSSVLRVASSIDRIRNGVTDRRNQKCAFRDHRRGGPHDQAGFLCREGVKFPGATIDNDRAEPVRHHAVQVALESRDVNARAVLGEGRDRHGVNASE